MENQMRLRWTSHQGTILSVLDALLSSESLVDVTLACEGHYLRAHKLILSACSPYFQELLNVDLTKHPIFFLNNVKYTELQALIQYMYRGEVNIAREALPSLLQVAQALKIRGLADVETTSNNITSDTIILPDLRQKPPPPAPIVAPQPPMHIPSTSNVHFTRNFQQPHSFAPQNVSSPIITAAPSSVPPPAKKTRIETITRPSAQTVQVKKQQAQLGDPRIVVHRLSAAQMDPLQTETPSSSTHHSDYESAVGYSNANYENQDNQQPESYPGVKVEEDAVNADLDLTEGDDEENSLSQSGFSESWQLGEGDTSGMAGDDGEVPGGSGGNNGGGAEGGEGRGRGLFSKNHLPFHDSDESDSLDESESKVDPLAQDYFTPNTGVQENPKGREEPQERLKNMKFRMCGTETETFGFQMQLETGEGGPKESSKANQNALRKFKGIGPRCNSVHSQTDHYFQCQLISDAARNLSFQIFWNLETNAQKKSYICSLVDFVKLRRIPMKANSRRAGTFVYRIRDDNQEPLRVCKKMFLSTFDVNQRQIQSWVVGEPWKSDLRRPGQ